MPQLYGWLARNVRRLRHERRLTIKQAAACGQLHWRLWQKIEAGESNATLRTVQRMSAALGVEPAVLLGRNVQRR